MATTTELPWTGERYVPGVCPEPDTEKAHLERYQWAAHFAKGRRVLDVGCGCGYGTAMLGSVATKAVGYDCDAASIEYAQEHYAEAGRVGFAIADAEESPFPPASFDVAVCFELLEHLDDPDTCLRAMWAMLDDRGLLIASTPNVAKLQPEAVFHKHAWRSLAFADLVERGGFFRVVAMLGQGAAEEWKLDVRRWQNSPYTTIVAVA